MKTYIIGLFIVTAMLLTGCNSNQKTENEKEDKHEHVDGDGHDHANEKDHEHSEGDGHDHGAEAKGDSHSPTKSSSPNSKRSLLDLKTETVAPGSFLQLHQNQRTDTSLAG
jgi:cobalt-zinc-cadmium efflux system membrane fusion protein